jgi:hypothetical protein
VASQQATVSPFLCVCENSIAFTSAKFRAFSSSGQKGNEIIVPSMSSGNLALPDETDNIVKIEYKDVNWQDLGCVSPVNSGETIKVDGVMNDFKVILGGHAVTPGACPNDD